MNLTQILTIYGIFSLTPNPSFPSDACLPVAFTQGKGICEICEICVTYATELHGLYRLIITNTNCTNYTNWPLTSKGRKYGVRLRTQNNQELEN